MMRVPLACCAIAAAVLACPTARAAEESPSVVKLMTSDIVVEPNGASTQTVHFEILATNEASAKSIGQPSLPYRETAQELESSKPIR